MEWKSRLAVEYDPEIPTDLLRTMERHARRLGAPMDTLELLGNDGDACRDFVRHAEAGAGDLFLKDLDELALRARITARRRPHSAPVFDDAAFVSGL